MSASYGPGTERIALEQAESEILRLRTELDALRADRVGWISVRLVGNGQRVRTSSIEWWDVPELPDGRYPLYLHAPSSERRPEPAADVAWEITLEDLKVLNLNGPVGSFQLLRDRLRERVETTTRG